MMLGFSFALVSRVSKRGMRRDAFGKVVQWLSSLSYCVIGFGNMAATCSSWKLLLLEAAFLCLIDVDLSSKESVPMHGLCVKFLSCWGCLKRTKEVAKSKGLKTRNKPTRNECL